MSVRPEEVKRLRDETGAGMMDAKRALTEASGEFEAARDLLRKWGLAGAAKRVGRAAREGGIFHYIHQPDPSLPPKVGVLVECNSETDFAAKTAAFMELGHKLARHVAAMEPHWVGRDDIPEDVMEREKKVIRESDEVAGKPAEVVDRIVEGKLGAWFSGLGGVLMDQPFALDDSGRSVAEVVGEVAAEVKENVVVRRFARFRIGEEG